MALDQPGLIVPPPAVILAGRDLAAAARLWRLVWALAWMDIKLRYRGSWLGPLWLSLSTAIMIAALGGLYPLLLGLPARDYVPYLATSLVLWNALVQLVADAAGAFVDQARVIHALPLPASVHAARTLLRTVLVAAHQAAILLPVFLLYGIVPDFGGALAGLLVWIVNGFFLVLVLGALSARFRDIPPIAASVMQLAFFVTPVIWRAEQLGPHAAWLHANPMHAMLAILRAPLLGQAVAPAHWQAAAMVTAAIALAGTAIFAATRARLAFWV